MIESGHYGFELSLRTKAEHSGHREPTKNELCNALTCDVQLVHETSSLRGKTQNSSKGKSRAEADELYGDHASSYKASSC